MVFTGVPGAQALGIDAGVKSVQAAESIGEGFIKSLVVNGWAAPVSGNYSGNNATLAQWFANDTGSGDHVSLTLGSIADTITVGTSSAVKVADNAMVYCRISEDSPTLALDADLDAEDSGWDQYAEISQSESASDTFIITPIGTKSNPEAYAGTVGRTGKVWFAVAKNSLIRPKAEGEDEDVLYDTNYLLPVYLEVKEPTINSVTVRGSKTFQTGSSYSESAATLAEWTDPKTENGDDYVITMKEGNVANTYTVGTSVAVQKNSQAEPAYVYYTIASQAPAAGPTDETIGNDKTWHPVGTIGEVADDGKSVTINMIGGSEQTIADIQGWSGTCLKTEEGKSVYFGIEADTIKIGEVTVREPYVAPVSLQVVDEPSLSESNISSVSVKGFNVASDYEEGKEETIGFLSGDEIELVNGNLATSIEMEVSDLGTIGLVDANDKGANKVYYIRKNAYENALATDAEAPEGGTNALRINVSNNLWKEWGTVSVNESGKLVLTANEGSRGYKAGDTTGYFAESGEYIFGIMGNVLKAGATPIVKDIILDNLVLSVSGEFEKIVSDTILEDVTGAEISDSNTGDHVSKGEVIINKEGIDISRSGNVTVVTVPAVVENLQKSNNGQTNAYWFGANLPKVLGNVEGYTVEAVALHEEVSEATITANNFNVATYKSVYGGYAKSWAEYAAGDDGAADFDLSSVNPPAGNPSNHLAFYTGTLEATEDDFVQTIILKYTKSGDGQSDVRYVIYYINYDIHLDFAKYSYDFDGTPVSIGTADTVAADKARMAAAHIKDHKLSFTESGNKTNATLVVEMEDESYGLADAIIKTVASGGAETKLENQNAPTAAVDASKHTYTFSFSFTTENVEGLKVEFVSGTLLGVTSNATNAYVKGTDPKSSLIGTEGAYSTNAVRNNDYSFTVEPKLSNLNYKIDPVEDVYVMVGETKITASQAGAAGTALTYATEPVNGIYTFTLDGSAVTDTVVIVADASEGTGKTVSYKYYIDDASRDTTAELAKINETEVNTLPNSLVLRKEGDSYIGTLAATIVEESKEAVIVSKLTSTGATITPSTTVGPDGGKYTFDVEMTAEQYSSYLKRGITINVYTATGQNVTIKSGSDLSEKSITVKTADSYQIDIKETYGQGDNTPGAYYGMDFSFTVTAASPDYSVASSDVQVKIGSSEAVSVSEGEDAVLTYSEGIYTVKGTAITGAVEIEITPAAKTYAVILDNSANTAGITITKIGKEDYDPQNVPAASKGKGYTFTLKADTGYALPSEIRVSKTNGGMVVGTASLADLGNAANPSADKNSKTMTAVYEIESSLITDELTITIPAADKLKVITIPVVSATIKPEYVSEASGDTTVITSSRDVYDPQVTLSGDSENVIYTNAETPSFSFTANDKLEVEKVEWSVTGVEDAKKTEIEGTVKQVEGQRTTWYTLGKEVWKSATEGAVTLTVATAVSATSVTINDVKYVEVGTPKQLSVTVQPSTASKNVSWEVTDIKQNGTSVGNTAIGSSSATTWLDVAKTWLDKDGILTVSDTTLYDETNRVNGLWSIIVQATSKGSSPLNKTKEIFILQTPSELTYYVSNLTDEGHPAALSDAEAAEAITYYKNGNKAEGTRPAGLTDGKASVFFTLADGYEFASTNSIILKGNADGAGQVNLTVTSNGALRKLANGVYQLDIAAIANDLNTVTVTNGQDLPEMLNYQGSDELTVTFCLVKKNSVSFKALNGAKAGLSTAVGVSNVVAGEKYYLEKGNQGTENSLVVFLEATGEGAVPKIISAIQTSVNAQGVLTENDILTQIVAVGSAGSASASGYPTWKYTIPYSIWGQGDIVFEVGTEAETYTVEKSMTKTENTTGSIANATIEIIGTDENQTVYESGDTAGAAAKASYNTDMKFTVTANPGFELKAATGKTDPVSIEIGNGVLEVGSGALTKSGNVYTLAGSQIKNIASDSAIKIVVYEVAKVDDDFVKPSKIAYSYVKDETVTGTSFDTYTDDGNPSSPKSPIWIDGQTKYDSFDGTSSATPKTRSIKFKLGNTDSTHYSLDSIEVGGAEFTSANLSTLTASSSINVDPIYDGTTDYSLTVDSNGVYTITVNDTKIVTENATLDIVFNVSTLAKINYTIKAGYVKQDPKHATATQTASNVNDFVSKKSDYVFVVSLADASNVTDATHTLSKSDVTIRDNGIVLSEADGDYTATQASANADITFKIPKETLAKSTNITITVDPAYVTYKVYSAANNSNVTVTTERGEEIATRLEETQGVKNAGAATYGSALEFYVVPEDGYQVSGVQISRNADESSPAGTYLTNSTTDTTLWTLAADGVNGSTNGITIIVTTAPETYTADLAVTVEGEGEAETPANYVTLSNTTGLAINAQTTFNVTQQTGYTITSVTANKQDSAKTPVNLEETTTDQTQAGTRTFLIPAGIVDNKLTINVTVKRNQFKINTTTSDNSMGATSSYATVWTDAGDITGASDTKVSYKQDAVFAVAPDDGFTIESVNVYVGGSTSALSATNVTSEDIKGTDGKSTGAKTYTVKADSVTGDLLIKVTTKGVDREVSLYLDSATEKYVAGASANHAEITVTGIKNGKVEQGKDLVFKVTNKAAYDISTVSAEIGDTVLVAGNDGFKVERGIATNSGVYTNTYTISGNLVKGDISILVTTKTVSFTVKKSDLSEGTSSILVDGFALTDNTNVENKAEISITVTPGSGYELPDGKISYAVAAKAPTSASGYTELTGTLSKDKTSYEFTIEEGKAVNNVWLLVKTYKTVAILSEGEGFTGNGFAYAGKDYTFTIANGMDVYAYRGDSRTGTPISVTISAGTSCKIAGSEVTRASLNDEPITILVSKHIAAIPVSYYIDGEEEENLYDDAAKDKLVTITNYSTVKTVSSTSDLSVKFTTATGYDANVIVKSPDALSDNVVTLAGGGTRSSKSGVEREYTLTVKKEGYLGEAIEVYITTSVTKYDIVYKDNKGNASNDGYDYLAYKVTGAPADNKTEKLKGFSFTVTPKSGYTIEDVKNIAIKAGTATLVYGTDYTGSVSGKSFTYIVSDSNKIAGDVEVTLTVKAATYTVKASGIADIYKDTKGGAYTATANYGEEYVFYYPKKVGEDETDFQITMGGSKLAQTEDFGITTNYNVENANATYNKVTIYYVTGNIVISVSKASTITSIIYAAAEDAVEVSFPRSKVSTYDRKTQSNSVAVNATVKTKGYVIDTVQVFAVTNPETANPVETLIKDITDTMTITKAIIGDNSVIKVVVATKPAVTIKGADSNDPGTTLGFTTGQGVINQAASTIQWIGGAAAQNQQDVIFTVTPAPGQTLDSVSYNEEGGATKTLKAANGSYTIPADAFSGEKDMIITVATHEDIDVNFTPDAAVKYTSIDGLVLKDDGSYVYRRTTSSDGFSFNIEAVDDEYYKVSDGTNGNSVYSISSGDDQKLEKANGATVYTFTKAQMAAATSVTITGKATEQKTIAIETEGKNGGIRFTGDEITAKKIGYNKDLTVTVMPNDTVNYKITSVKYLLDTGEGYGEEDTALDLTAGANNKYTLSKSIIGKAKSVKIIATKDVVRTTYKVSFDKSLDTKNIVNSGTVGRNNSGLTQDCGITAPATVVTGGYAFDGTTDVTFTLAEKNEGYRISAISYTNNGENVNVDLERVTSGKVFDTNTETGKKYYTVTIPKIDVKGDIVISAEVEAVEASVILDKSYGEIKTVLVNGQNLSYGTTVTRAYDKTSAMRFSLEPKYAGIYTFTPTVKVDGVALADNKIAMQTANTAWTVEAPDIGKASSIVISFTVGRQGGKGLVSFSGAQDYAIATGKTAEVYFSNNYAEDQTKLRFVTTDPAVATVVPIEDNKTGIIRGAKITAKEVGSAKIEVFNGDDAAAEAMLNIETFNAVKSVKASVTSLNLGAGKEYIVSISSTSDASNTTAKTSYINQGRSKQDAYTLTSLNPNIIVRDSGNGTFTIHAVEKSEGQKGQILVTAKDYGTQVGSSTVTNVGGTIKDNVKINVTVVAGVKGITLTQNGKAVPSDTNDDTYMLALGSKLNLKAEVFDTTGVKAKNQGVNWESDNEQYVDVTAKGVVTGLKDGEIATITATSQEDNTVQATYKVKVYRPVGKVSLDGLVDGNKALTAAAGSSIQILVTADELDVENDLLEKGGITWEITDKNGVFVDYATSVENARDVQDIETATFIGKAIDLNINPNLTKAGTATVKVTLTDKGLKKTTKSVSVKGGLAVDNIALLNGKTVLATSGKTTKYGEDTVRGELNLLAGKNQKVNAEVLTAGDKAPTIKDLNWQSSDRTVATVKNGTVTAVGAGEAVITATSMDGSDISAEFDVIVDAPVQKIDFQQGGSVTLSPEATFTAQIVLNPENPTEGYEIRTETEGSVTTVLDGLNLYITANANAGGTSAKVKVTAVNSSELKSKLGAKNVKDVSKTLNVKIAKADQVVDYIQVASRSNVLADSIEDARKENTDPAKLVLVKGKTATIKGNAYTAAGKKAGNQSFSYSSSNPEVVTIDPDKGKIKAVADGTATITVMSNEIKADGSDVFATFNVQVVSGASLTKKVSLTANKVTVANKKGDDVGQYEQNSFTIGWADGVDVGIINKNDQGKALTAVDGQLTYSVVSSKPEIATVTYTDAGTYTVWPKRAGSATLTIQPNDTSGKKTTLRVTVVERVESVEFKSTASTPADKNVIYNADTEEKTASVKQNGSLSLKPIIRSVSGENKAADKTVKYISSDTSVATVTKSGQVKVLKEARIGAEVTITVLTTDGNCTDSVTVKVIAK